MFASGTDDVIAGGNVVLDESGCRILARVKSPWPHSELVIALHSPTTSSKPDCGSDLRRKGGTLTRLHPEQSVLRWANPSRRCGRIGKYGHVSRILRKIDAAILCSTDCVAEREGFEHSVQVLARTTV